MDFLFFIIYFLLFSLFGWILVKKDCKLAMYLIALMFILGILEATYLFYYRSQGFSYRNIVNHLLMEKK